MENNTIDNTRMHSSRMRPLVARISQHALLWEVYLLGVYLTGGYTWPGVYLLGGYLPGGGSTCPMEVYLLMGCTCSGVVPAHGVYLLREGVPAQVVPPCEQNDWQTGVKT